MDPPHAKKEAEGQTESKGNDAYKEEEEDDGGGGDEEEEEEEEKEGEGAVGAALIVPVATPSSCRCRCSTVRYSRSDSVSRLNNDTTGGADDEADGAGGGVSPPRAAPLGDADDCRGRSTGWNRKSIGSVETQTFSKGDAG